MRESGAPARAAYHGVDESRLQSASQRETARLRGARGTTVEQPARQAAKRKETKRHLPGYDSEAALLAMGAAKASAASSASMMNGIR